PQAVAVLGTDVVLGPRLIGLARQDEDVVSKQRVKRAGVSLRVDLGAPFSRRRKAVDDDENLHPTSLERDDFHPLIAARAPRYCPAGHATARPIDRPARTGLLHSWTAYRKWTRTDDATARMRCGRSGMVRSAKSSYSRRCSAKVRENS